MAPRLQDPESVIEVPSSSRSSSEMTYGSVEEGSKAPLVPTATPFFHFDLTAAVRSAESGSASRELSTYGTFDGKDA